TRPIALDLRHAGAPARPSLRRVRGVRRERARGARLLAGAHPAHLTVRRARSDAPIGQRPPDSSGRDAPRAGRRQPGARGMVAGRRGRGVGAGAAAVHHRRGFMARLVVHVVPRARRTEVSGWHGDAIKIKVAAPPVEGAANAELVRFVAERVGVTRGAVTIASGAAARRKTVAVEGVTADALARALLHRD